MTQVDIVFRYRGTPGERTAIALGTVREVYGIRKVTLNEGENTVRVEYDSTRLTAETVHNLLRRTGLDVEEKVAGYQQEETVPAA